MKTWMLIGVMGLISTGLVVAAVAADQRRDVVEIEQQVQQMAREVGTHMPARMVPHDWWWGNGNRAHGPIPRIAAWTLIREEADESLCLEHWCTVLVASEQISYNEPSSYWFYKRSFNKPSPRGPR